MTFHFLCEGEKDKAEYTFIRHVIAECCKGETYILEASEGNRKLLPKFLAMSRAFNPGDVFILFFDHVESISGVPVPVLLHDISGTCSRYDVVFRYTTYYCFEELFLSYAGIESILGPGFIHYMPQVEAIQQDILSGKNYFKSRDLSVWRHLIGNGFNNIKTREKFSSILCTRLLQKTQGIFKLTKDSIGDCWIKSCSDMDKSKLGGGRVCEKCSYCCKDNTFREKLRDLDDNSVAKLGLPFSGIFDRTAYEGNPVL